MKVLSDFVLNYETFLFYPHHDDFGNLTTAVFGNQQSVLVGMKPTALIDFNLKYHGSSLEGANAGAKAILGNVKMPPIVINKTLGIYWLPMKSPSKADCVWLALHHVKDYSNAGEGRTKVIFTDGFSVTLEVSHYSFHKKVQRAYELKGKIDRRTRELEFLPGEQQSYLNEKISEYAFEADLQMHFNHMKFGMGKLKFDGAET